MVTQWGFSEEIGPVDYGEDQGEVFLGQQLVQSSSISAETAAKIEKEVKGLVEAGLDEARRILTEKNDDWVALAEGLLEYETLSGAEIKALLAGEKPVRDTSVPPRSDDQTPPSGAVPTVDDEDESEASTPSGGLEPKPGGA
jgi:cell division protease FtsH